MKSKKETLKVYPNPFNNTLNISDIKDVKSISISDAAGRVIKTIEKPSIILELNDLEKGVYFVNLHFKNGTVKSFKSVKN
ncbi:T9SS type A sorting domain-containing protein [Chryseobacterium arachidis]|uniref:T9SS type A sorting domain-containing protein n=1 Tax=Chryseobacterium arachidis TaxID=1416778 RepID=UPI0036167F5E